MFPLMLAPLKGLLSPAPKPVCTEAGVADYKSPTRDLWGETFTVLEDMVEEMSYLDKSSQERFQSGSDGGHCEICAEEFGTLRWKCHTPLPPFII